MIHMKISDCCIFPTKLLSVRKPMYISDPTAKGVTVKQHDYIGCSFLSPKVTKNLVIKPDRYHSWNFETKNLDLLFKCLHINQPICLLK